MPRSRNNEDDMATPILHSTGDIEEDAGVIDELTGCGASPCCNPSHAFHRFIALIFMCLIGFGSYFCYDNPGALQDNFKKDMSLSTTQFVMLYSIYSWPNVILCFIGGFLIDRVFGIRLGTIIYMFILMIGQLIFAMGGVLNAFNLMILGRFVFGIGAESLAVAQNNYAVLWFKGKELNMVFGLQLSFARVGSTINFIVMEPLYKYINQYYKGYMCTGVVLLLAGLTCVMSMICALILGWMDKRAERILKRNDNPSGEIPKLSDITTFKISFWMITVICVAYYVAIFPFIALGKVFFEGKYGFTAEQANAVNSIVYIISAVASPLLGLVIDKTGKNVMWVFLSIILTICAHSILGFTFLNPYVGMSLMGLAYSLLASSLWPLVALVIPEYQLGTAYGICQSVQNLGLAIITLLSGIIVDKGGFFMLEIFFIGCLSVALIATVVIWLHDSGTNGILNKTPKERDIHAGLIEPSVFEHFPTFIKRSKSSNFYDSHVEATAKLLASGSAEDLSGDNAGGESSVNDATIRNRYLKRVGVQNQHPSTQQRAGASTSSINSGKNSHKNGDADNASDCEPLLH